MTEKKQYSSDLNKIKAFIFPATKVSLRSNVSQMQKYRVERPKPRRQPHIFRMLITACGFPFSTQCFYFMHQNGGSSSCHCVRIPTSKQRGNTRKRIFFKERPRSSTNTCPCIQAGALPLVPRPSPCPCI